MQKIMSDLVQHTANLSVFGPIQQRIGKLEDMPALYNSVWNEDPVFIGIGHKKYAMFQHGIHDISWNSYQDSHQRIPLILVTKGNYPAGLRVNFLKCVIFLGVTIHHENSLWGGWLKTISEAPEQKIKFHVLKAIFLNDKILIIQTF